MAAEVVLLQKERKWHLEAVLVLEEGQPEYIEQEIATHLHRRGSRCAVHGKDFLKQSGEYSTEAILRGLSAFAECYAALLSQMPVTIAKQYFSERDTAKSQALEVLGKPLPVRPPTFCVGCPERPVFSALKMVHQHIGVSHISTDIGCHAFATFAPFSLGNSILGYGMSMASSAAVAPLSERRPLATGCPAVGYRCCNTAIRP